MQNKGSNIDRNKGKSSVLQAILRILSQKGKFNDCYLVDEQGMPIASFAVNSPSFVNSNTVGALFSLINNSLSRTMNGLKLKHMDYFKFVAENGVFMVKNIKIEDYARDFLLLTYHEKKETASPSRGVEKSFFGSFIAKLKFWEGSTASGTDMEARRNRLMENAATQIRDLFRREK